MQKSKRIPIDINESLYEAPIITNLNEQDRPDAGRELKQEVVVYDEKKNEYKSKIKASLKYKKGVKKKAQNNSKDNVSENSSIADRTEHLVKKFRQKFIILHYSPFKAVWDWIVLLLVVYTAVFTPFTISFLLNESEKRAKLNQHASTRIFKNQQSGADPFVIIDLVVDLMFMMDIFISFRTTFVSKEGEAVYDPMIIAKTYLKGWFIIDAVSAMPYDLILFGSGNLDTLKITGLLKITRLIRLIRIFPKLQKFSDYGIAMLLLLMAAFALVGHWLACVFYAIAYIERPTLPEPKYSWLDHLAEKYNMPYHENNSESGPDLKSKYITALFFTLTSLTSVGFGNVSPTTNWEKIFSIASMLLGSLISAAIFGNVTTIMMKMYQGTEELKEMQEYVKDFIKFHGIPKDLQKRMHESFEHTWSYTNGIDMDTVLKSFPESLQADICLHLNRRILAKCKAFHDASDGCLRILSLKFKSTHVPPGDTLIHKGDNLTAIYFIARGTIEIVQDDEIVAILEKNDIFGENIAKYKERDIMGRSICDVRAISYCDLHKIERADLLEVLVMYPDFAESFESKFKVTFDLRECELDDQLNKLTGKKSKAKFKQLVLEKQRQRMNSERTSENESCENQSLLRKGSNISETNMNVLECSQASNKSVFQKAPEIIEPAEEPGDVLQTSISETSSPNNTNRLTNLLKKKTRLLRNVSRLTPSSNLSQAGSFGSNLSFTNSTCKNTNAKISNTNEIESELENLFARVAKMEANTNSQLELLKNFIANYVIKDTSYKESTAKSSIESNDFSFTTNNQL